MFNSSQHANLISSLWTWYA